jgi:hypothetical protein
MSNRIGSRPLHIAAERNHASRRGSILVSAWPYIPVLTVAVFSLVTLERFSPYIVFIWTSKETLANARASSIVGWISVRNKILFHCYHIISNHVTVNRIVVNYRKLAYKISCMWVTSLANSKIDPELLGHMLKHPCKWYWLCKPKHSSYDAWLEHVVSYHK